jgi:hypothetical protein
MVSATERMASDRVAGVLVGRLAMNVKFQVEKPDDVVATLTITMTLRQWKELRDQLNQSWPSWKLAAAITDVLYQTTKPFYEQNEAK